MPVPPVTELKTFWAPLNFSKALMKFSIAHITVFLYSHLDEVFYVMTESIPSFRRHI